MVNTEESQPSGGPAPRRTMSANAVVAYNLRALRLRYGWSQERLAEELGAVTGRVVTQAAISAREMTVNGGPRQSRFDAQDLYVYSTALGVPIAYFFTPPPEEAVDGAVLADTEAPLWSLLVAFLGADHQLKEIDERLQILERQGADAVIDTVLGPVPPGAPSWSERYQVWRAERIEHLMGHDRHKLLDAVEFLHDFAAQLQAQRRQLHEEFDADREGPGPAVPHDPPAAPARTELEEDSSGTPSGNPEADQPWRGGAPGDRHRRPASR